MADEEDSEVLLQFRAGRLTKLPGASTVQPDPRKGLVRIVRGDDLLVHVQWLDRTNEAMMRVEEDFIVLPDEAVFQKVSQSSGRVYLLSFTGDERKFFYWMQEPVANDDERICDEVNRCLNEGLADEDDEDDEMLVGERDLDLNAGAAGLEEDLGALIGAVAGGAGSGGQQGLGPGGSAGGAGGTAGGLQRRVLGGALGVGQFWGQPVGNLDNMQAQQAAAALAASLQMGQMRSLVSGLSSIVVPPELLVNVPPLGPSPQHLRMLQEPELPELLSPQLLLSFLNDQDVQERLRPHLPEALQTKEQMQQLVQSPQFQQQLQTLSLLLRSGRIDLAQFGIDANKHGYGVSSFLRAIQDQTPVTLSAGAGPSEMEGKDSGGSEKQDSKASSGQAGEAQPGGSAGAEAREPSQSQEKDVKDAGDRGS